MFQCLSDNFLSMLRWLSCVCIAAALFAGCSDGAATDVETDEIVEFVQGDWGDRGDEWDRIHRQEVELCMKQQGFDLEPPQQQRQAGSSTQSVTAAEDFGWVASLRDSHNPQVAKATIATPPNLSETEQLAFETALWGLVDAPPGQEDGGCNSHAKTIADETSGIAELWPFRDPVASKVEAAYSTAEYTALQKDWVRCMASAGFDVSGIPEMYNLVSDRWQALNADGLSDDPAQALEETLHRTHQSCNAELDDWLDQTVREAVETVLSEQ